MIKKDSIEDQILRILQDRYPITLEEIKREVRVKPERIDRAVRALLDMDYIELDILPDKTFVRLKVVFGSIKFDDKPDRSSMYG
jgi:DNA-binding MarR family transcriptional regulator